MPADLKFIFNLFKVEGKQVEWLEGMKWSGQALLDLARLTKRRTNRGVELVQEGLHLILGMKVQLEALISE